MHIEAFVSANKIPLLIYRDSALG
ncbi:uncharacterized protein METZ01_LOCUS199516 [marine metagenome]|uniref:Uncharacterized protein n=1 Tax=marine metagenome TaxID=408172 RepID=A0A382E8H2_9ZZZZ